MSIRRMITSIRTNNNKKNLLFLTGLVHYWIFLDYQLEEAAGIEQDDNVRKASSIRNVEIPSYVFAYLICCVPSRGF